MQVLIAEDNDFYRRMVEVTVQAWDYQTLAARDGEEAWQHLRNKDAPKLALIDWTMPRLDGIELCRRIRATPELQGMYLILVTAKDNKSDAIKALESGADDFLTKPFDRDELRARLKVGERVVGLQSALAANVAQLEEAFHGAQKMEAVGRLAGGVAHDFNNLLTVITGASSLLSNHHSCDGSARKLAKMIEDAAQRGASLTGQLLAFSRKQVLKPNVLDLNQVIRGVGKLLQRLIGEDVHLATELDSSPAFIKADAGQIEQVLLNLAVNSRDAMPGGGRIFIRTRPLKLIEEVDGVSDCVEVAIRDTGSGIPDDIMPHIFEPFFTTKETGKGTGLGLATVYGIVKQSGGRIRVESKVGEGTTFYLIFPITHESPVIDIPSTFEAGEANEGATVLLAEDDDSVRQVIRTVLDLNGFAVLEASCGDEAIRLCEDYRDSIDLLITDVIMPGMGGQRLAEYLLKKRPDTLLLFISGHTNDLVLRNQLEDQSKHFLQKPFAPKTLIDKVYEILRTGRRAHAVTPSARDDVRALLRAGRS